jgi:hypothetical protein
LGAYLILLLRKEYDSGDGLIGGETAELLSTYSPGEYDLAGFAVGAVHRNCILLQSVEVVDILLRLQRSREHRNGVLAWCKSYWKRKDYFVTMPFHGILHLPQFVMRC